MRIAIRQVSSPMILRPAYGRSYKTQDEMLKDWNDGKDFRISSSGPYCSIRDLDQMKSVASSIVILDLVYPVSVRVA